MRLGLQALAAVALAAAALSCDGEDPAPPPDEPIDTVTRYLPGDAALLVFADLAAAREQLGLPADADAFGTLAKKGYDPESPEAQLLEAAQVAMPGLGLAPVKGETVPITEPADLDIDFSDLPEPQPDPFTEAFDGRAIAAAATASAAGGERGSLTAIRTSQPFDELAAALARQGYERDEAVLAKPGAPIDEVADAGDGVVVFSSREASAAEAIADPGGGPSTALSLLEPADEPIAMATTGLADSCVTEYGGWQDASGASGAFRLAIDGTADVDRVQLEEFEKFTGTEPGEPSADGNAVEVPFSGGEGGAGPLRGLLVSFGRLYDCD